MIVRRAFTCLYQLRQRSGSRKASADSQTKGAGAGETASASDKFGVENYINGYWKIERKKNL